MKKDYLERQSYPTDLTDDQWTQIEPLFVVSGCKWRQLPHDFPPHFTVHSFYRRARLNVTRQRAYLSENPTQALIDSQSVKTTGAVEQKGFNMGKKQKAENDK